MKCENCGNEHNGSYGSGRFCSQSCSKSFSTKLKRKEINEKVSKTITFKINNGETIGCCKKTSKLYNCEYCGTEYIRINKSKYCCNLCKNLSMKNKISKKVHEKIKNGTHSGWKSRPILSYPEKFFKRVLELNGLKNEFIVNYKVCKKDLGLNENSNYFLDFYFDKYKLDLEIDGKQHDYLDRKISDNIRDTLLKSNGYKVYRIKWKSINNKSGKDYIKNEINEFLKMIHYFRDVG